VSLLKKKKNKISISMTRSGDPLENAVAERVNKTIKEEFTDDRQMNFSNLEQSKIQVRKYVDFYNQERPHQNVDMLTPNEAHERTGSLKRKWKTYYRQMRSTVN
jgi:putative transposase